MHKEPTTLHTIYSCLFQIKNITDGNEETEICHQWDADNLFIVITGQTIIKMVPNCNNK